MKLFAETASSPKRCVPKKSARQRERLEAALDRFIEKVDGDSRLGGSASAQPKPAASPKPMMSEAKNLPELAALYQRKVIQPGKQLIRRLPQRGGDRREFRGMDLDYAIHTGGHR